MVVGLWLLMTSWLNNLAWSSGLSANHEEPRCKFGLGTKNLLNKRCVPMSWMFWHVIWANGCSLLGGSWVPQLQSFGCSLILVWAKNILLDITHLITSLLCPFCSKAWPFGCCLSQLWKNCSFLFAGWHVENQQICSARSWRTFWCCLLLVCQFCPLSVFTYWPVSWTKRVPWSVQPHLLVASSSFRAARVSWDSEREACWSVLDGKSIVWCYILFIIERKHM